MATSGNVQVMYADVFTSVSDNADLSFGIVDNFRVLIKPPAVLTPGDWDDDGDSDLDDFERMVDCLSGPGATLTPSLDECVEVCLAVFDYDDDEDVDLYDFSAFQRGFAP